MLLTAVQHSEIVHGGLEAPSEKKVSRSVQAIRDADSQSVMQLSCLAASVQVIGRNALLMRDRRKRIEDILQDSDVLTEALKEFADEFPQLMRPLIEERDEYMVFLLRTLAIRWAPPLSATSCAPACIVLPFLQRHTGAWNASMEWQPAPVQPTQADSSSQGGTTGSHE